MSNTRVSWLHTNRRALWLGVVVLSPALAVAAGVATMSSHGWLRWAAATAALCVAYVIGLCVYLMFQPRLALSLIHI